MSEKQFIQVNHIQFNRCILLLPQVTEAIHVELSFTPPLRIRSDYAGPIDDFTDLSGSILIELHGLSLHAWYLEACKLGPVHVTELMSYRQVRMLDRRCICCLPGILRTNEAERGDGNDQA